MIFPVGGGKEEKGVSVLDTTCPIVTRSKQWAKRLTEEGFAVIVFGDPNHKETRGVLGWAEGNAYAIPKDRQLGQDYLDKNIRVVNNRLSVAGVRLAALLNAVFDDTKELPF